MAESFGYQIYLNSSFEVQAVFGPGFYTVRDTADGSNDNQVAVGDQLYSDFNLTAYTVVGTTANGVIVSGGFYDYTLYSRVSYSNGATIGPVNTTDLYLFCFLGGTMLATANGEVAVEYLKVGDQVTTADGRDVAVTWVGEQRVKNWMFTPESQTPVCISKGALGEGVPHSDLYVSSDHGMIIDEYVINAGALVNGSTIRFVPMAEMPSEFTYYHIETEAHDVVLANGAAAETFIDAAGRATFDNHQEYLDLHGAERIIPEMDRARISSSRMVPEAIKARLAPAADWDAAMMDPDMVVTLSRGAA